MAEKQQQKTFTIWFSFTTERLRHMMTNATWYVSVLLFSFFERDTFVSAAKSCKALSLKVNTGRSL